MTPDLQARIQALTDTQRTELRLVLERIEQMGRHALADLDEHDLHTLLDEIVKPTAYEVASCMSSRELDAFSDLAKARGKPALSLDEASLAVPWLGNEAEVARRVHEYRSRPVDVSYDPND